MNQMKIETVLRNKVGEIAEIIRKYCLSQKGLWQEIPQLAIRASGYPVNGRYQMAAQCRLWPIEQTSFPWRICINLNSGELVSGAGNSISDRKTVSDDEVLGLISRLDLLNASLIIERIKSEAD